MKKAKQYKFNRRRNNLPDVSVLLGLFFFISFSACAALSAQQSKNSAIEPIFTLPVKATHFGIDKLGQCYVLTAPNELTQYSNRGKEFFRYNNNYLGQLHFMDATNPFSLLLFYKDFSTIITLDRTLSQTGEVNLLELDIVDVNAVGVSNDNNIWLYDEVAFRLKKISRVGEIIYESDPLSLVFDTSLSVNFIIERNNQVFLNDPQQGVYVFDLYGRYLRKIDLKGLERFQIIDEHIIFRKEKNIKTFHLKTLNEQTITLPFEIADGEEVLLQRDRFFVVRPDELSLYHLPKGRN